MEFFISNKAYSKWFKNRFTIYYEPTLVDIPEPLTECEKLFDKIKSYSWN